MITEREVGIDLVGHPRWWTIENARGICEVVRVVFERGKHYDTARNDEKAPEEMVLFAILPLGKYTFPPFVAAALRMGRIGWDSVAKDGGKVVPYPTAEGRKLETLLMGVKR